MFVALKTTALILLISGNVSVGPDGNQPRDSGRADASAAALDGVWSCDDNGTYYLREVGDEVFWFGENRVVTPTTELLVHRTVRPPRSIPPIAVPTFANVFRGVRDGNTVRGRWFDVPKGSARGSGELVLALVNTELGITQFRVVSQTGGFGGRVCNLGGANRLGPEFVPAGYQTRVGEYTGTWMGDDGGTYYVRQIGREVVWFAEHPHGGWAHVFFGRILRIRSTRTGPSGPVTTTETRINGTWVDVPKAAARGTGQIGFTRDSSFLLRRHVVTGGFGGTRLMRVESFYVDVRLDSLIVEDADDPLSPDEIHLWPAFVKTDGDSLDASGDRSFSLTARGEYGYSLGLPCYTHWCYGNVRRDDGGQPDTDDRLGIHRELGLYRTILKSIRGMDPTSRESRTLTRLAVIVFAWERDESGRYGSAFDAWERALRQQIGENVRTMLPPRMMEAARMARRASVHAMERVSDVQIDTHDPFSVDGIVIRWVDFRSGPSFGRSALQEGRPIPLNFSIRSSTGRYRIAGVVQPWYRAGRGAPRPW